jgi:hypothetical protein
MKTDSINAVQYPEAESFEERNPDCTPDEIEHVLNRVFSDLISYDTVTRLSQSKDKQIELSL